MREDRSRFETGILPDGEGEFDDTGCHTPEGNNLCLYVGTTEELFDDKVRAFREVLAQRRRWKGATEFSVPMRLQRAAEALFDDASRKYNREFNDDTGVDALPSCRGMFEDFLRWLCRDFEQWAVEQAIVGGKGDAA